MTGERDILRNSLIASENVAKGFLVDESAYVYKYKPQHKVRFRYCTEYLTI